MNKVSELFTFTITTVYVYTVRDLAKLKFETRIERKAGVTIYLYVKNCTTYSWNLHSPALMKFSVLIVY